MRVMWKRPRARLFSDLLAIISTAAPYSDRFMNYSVASQQKSDKHR
jgi:hypothetical protein